MKISMQTAMHNRCRLREPSRRTHAARFTRGVLSLPTAVAQAGHAIACAMRDEGMADIEASSKLCWARVRRDDR